MFGLTFTVLAGDFGTGVGSFSAGEFKLPTGGAWEHQTVPSSMLGDVGVATQENVKKFGGAAGVGLLGAFFLRPIGGLAGVLAGGNRTNVTFVVRFRNGPKFLARGDAKVFTSIQAAAFNVPTAYGQKIRRRVMISAAILAVLAIAAFIGLRAS
jgi:hypothetical protein